VGSISAQRLGLNANNSVENPGTLRDDYEQPKSGPPSAAERLKADYLNELAPLIKYGLRPEELDPTAIPNLAELANAAAGEDLLANKLSTIFANVEGRVPGTCALLGIGVGTRANSRTRLDAAARVIGRFKNGESLRQSPAFRSMPGEIANALVALAARRGVLIPRDQTATPAEELSAPALPEPFARGTMGEAVASFREAYFAVLREAIEDRSAVRRLWDDPQDERGGAPRKTFALPDYRDYTLGLIDGLVDNSISFRDLRGPDASNYICRKPATMMASFMGLDVSSLIWAQPPRPRQPRRVLRPKRNVPSSRGALEIAASYGLSQEELTLLSGVNEIETWIARQRHRGHIELQPDLLDTSYADFNALHFLRYQALLTFSFRHDGRRCYVLFFTSYNCFRTTDMEFMGWLKHTLDVDERSALSSA
jgi:hypothetical protein